VEVLRMVCDMVDAEPEPIRSNFTVTTLSFNTHKNTSDEDEDDDDDDDAQQPLNHRWMAPVAQLLGQFKIPNLESLAIVICETAGWRDPLVSMVLDLDRCLSAPVALKMRTLSLVFQRVIVGDVLGNDFWVSVAFLPLER
jgi:hypothetical protein